MLRDASGFAGGHVGFADGVEQRGLAVIDVAHDGDHGRARHFELVGVFGFEHLFDGLVRDLLFVADDGGGSAELGGHVLHHLGVERLVDGDEDAAHEQRGDQVLGADVELFGQVLDADALGDGDLAGDGHRLVAVLHAAIARRRHKALHRAFFGLGILLLATAAAARGGALRARSFAGGRCAAGSGTRAEAGTALQIQDARQNRAVRRELPGRRAPESACSSACGMLGARAAGKLAGSAGAAGKRCPEPGLTAAGLRSKIGLPRCSPGASRGSGRGRRNDGRLVDRPGPGLRHHHAARRGALRARGLARCFAASGCGFGGDGGNRSRRFRRGNVEFQEQPAQAGSRTAADGAGGSTTAGAARQAALTACFSSRAAGAAGGLTTTPAGGGATTTTGRVAAAPAGALATTAPAGGRVAMAGGAGGGAIMGGAERGCGTILRGSGRAGRAAAGCGSRRGDGAAAAGGARLGVRGGLGRRSGCRLHRHASVARLFFLFLLLGQNGLHHIAGLGDVREIDLGDDGLPRRGGRPQRCMRAEASLPAQIAREPSPPRPPPASWSASCRQPRRVPEECRESRET